jgi:hypothetical protein
MAALSTHRRWLPPYHRHHYREQEHGRCAHQRQLTRPESARRRGQGRVGKLSPRGTLVEAHPSGCE